MKVKRDLTRVISTPLGEQIGGQTLSLPPPGIETGSPASHAGTLPKELSRQLIR
jgi:hypothetical protein